MLDPAYLPLALSILSFVFSLCSLWLSYLTAKELAELRKQALLKRQYREEEYKPISLPDWPKFP